MMVECFMEVSVVYRRDSRFKGRCVLEKENDEWDR